MLSILVRSCTAQDYQAVSWGIDLATSMPQAEWRSRIEINEPRCNESQLLLCCVNRLGD